MLLGSTIRHGKFHTIAHLHLPWPRYYITLTAQSFRFKPNSLGYLFPLFIQYVDPPYHCNLDPDGWTLGPVGCNADGVGQGYICRVVLTTNPCKAQHFIKDS